MAVTTNAMTGKNAMISGGGSGIGRAVAKRLARERARVAVLDINEAGARATVDQVRAEGGEAEAYRADISDAASVEQAVAAVVADFGGLTTLVNAAGIFDDNAPLHKTDEALWDRVLAVDLKGMFLTVKAALPHLRASGNASIVNISSVAGVVARSGGLAYTTAKHGVLGLTKSIAADYGPEVRCNAVLPGLVRTAMTEYVLGDDAVGVAMRRRALSLPAARVADADEIASAVLFLASDEASFMYGAHLAVDGGRTIV